jgi:hypothetical protein
VVVATACCFTEAKPEGHYAHGHSIADGAKALDQWAEDEGYEQTEVDLSKAQAAMDGGVKPQGQPIEPMAQKVQPAAIASAAAAPQAEKKPEAAPAAVAAVPAKTA